MLSNTRASLCAAAVATAETLCSSPALDYTVGTARPSLSERAADEVALVARAAQHTVGEHQESEAMSTCERSAGTAADGQNTSAVR